MALKNVKIHDGIWIFQKAGTEVWHSRIKMPDGTWDRRSTGERDQGKAGTAAIMRAGGASAVAKIGKTLETPRFSHVSKLYIEQLDERKKAGDEKPIHRNYRQYVKTWLDPFFGNKRIDEIDYKIILQWMSWRVKNRADLEARFGKDWMTHPDFKNADVEKLSRSTVNAINVVLREIFAIARRERWITADQDMTVHLQNNGAKGESRDWFNEAEWKAIVEWMDANCDPNGAKTNWVNTGHSQKTRHMRELLRWYVLILNDSGMRPGDELEGVRWKDVDMNFVADDGVSRVQVHVTDGKMATRGKDRWVTLQPGADRYFKAIAEFTGKTDPDDFVILLPPTKSSPAIRPHRWSDIFHDMLLKMGWTEEETDGHSLYSVRHTYITQRLLNNVNPVLIADNAGTSIAMIQKTYSKLRAWMNAGDLTAMRPERTAAALTQTSHDENTLALAKLGILVPTPANPTK